MEYLQEFQDEIPTFQLKNETMKRKGGFLYGIPYKQHHMTIH
jgi:hypothetical protein